MEEEGTVREDRSIERLSGILSRDPSVPQIGESELRRLLVQVFSVDAENIAQLIRFCTYEDLAYVVRLKKGDALILKIVNANDSRKSDVQKGMDELMHHLSTSGLNVPIPLQSAEKGYHSLVRLDYTNGSDGEHVVRLVKMIPGEMLVKARPYTAQLLGEVGEMVGRLHCCLRTFDRPECFIRPNFLWDLSNLHMIGAIIPKLFANDPKRSKLVKEIINCFETLVRPHETVFCKGLIHNDLNEQNILVDEQLRHVHAIIDFGDAVHSFYVYDIASCISYMTLDVPEDQILYVGKHVLVSYLPVFSLTPVEQSVIPYCVAARLMQSLVLSLHAASNLPPNDIKLEHILLTQKRGWYVLEKLWDYGAEKLAELWA